MSLLREVFKREDLPASTPAPGTPAILQPSEAPAEKKRQYSISGWTRSEDGSFTKDTALIWRRGKTWVRVENVLGDEVTYPSLHTAIKGGTPEAPAAPLLDETGTPEWTPRVDSAVDSDVDGEGY